MIISPNASLYSSIVSGPYRERFLKNYAELSDQVSTFLNQDWLLQPQMRFACSRLLVGATLLLPPSDESIVVNSAEIYGRTRSVDSHRQSFKARRGASMRNSYPPESTTYCNIWPTTINDSDGNKLMIGSKTFNILVTSSMRLDKRCDPELGPTTNSFMLDTDEKSLNTKIFIKETAWAAATTLADDPTANQISSYDVLCQLRQLRTKFHHESTCTLCRASSEMTDDVTSRPYTAAPYLLEAGEKTKAKDFMDTNSDNIDSINNKLPKSKVLALNEKDNNIDIIGNSGLNTQLEKIANQLASSIAKANKSVKPTIIASFNQR
ncbi:hypothetical protein [Absidia glauca]|uniref:Uncharacterized protein n=1 Tax=Absidia glauca TaxID=4829 RepID=A0A168LZG4_ABSGL|nr:hypothetical protein [Absidia glauca]